MLIHPAKVVEISRHVGIPDARTRCLPAFPTSLAMRALVGTRPIQHITLAAVETQPFRAGSHCQPGIALAVDVYTTGVKGTFGHLINLCNTGLGRVVAAI